MIFSTAYFPLIGGAEIATQDITQSLREYSFDLICARLERDLPRKERIDRVNVYRIGFGGRMDKYLLPFFGCWKALKLHRKKKYKGIWSVMASYNSFAALFFKWINSDVPFLLTLQEGDSIEQIKEKTKYFKILFKAIFKKADHIQCISEYLSELPRQMGVRAEISIVPNPVALEKFLLTPEKRQKIRQQMRQSFELKKNDKVIISASRLVSKNGIADLVKAVSKLQKAKLLLIGNGPLKFELKELAERLGVGQRVIFFGTVRHQDLPSYLAMADVFCRPSLSEGLGTAFLEAMAVGLPVVATPAGGIVDFIIDGQTGLLAKTRNAIDLAKKLERVIQSDELANTISRTGQQLVAQNYSQKTIEDKMRNVFKKVFI